MPTYKNIAVVGAGVVGDGVVKALVENDANVIVITRPESTAKSLPESVKQIRVPFTDVDALAATFAEHKTEVVIASLGGTAILTQIPVADAAVKAGVKLFVPSEFGFPTVGATEGVLGQKQTVVDHLKNIGLPYTRIFTGVFYAYFPWLVDHKDGKIHIVGSGNQKATLTDLSDIVGYIAYVTTHVPPSKLENKILRMQGESKTLREVAALYGDKAEVVHVEKLEGFADGLQRYVDSGKGSTGYDAVLGRNAEGENAAGAANALWEGHKWVTVKEGLGL